MKPQLWIRPWSGWRTFNGLERNKVQIVERAVSWSEERLRPEEYGKDCTRPCIGPTITWRHEERSIRSEFQVKTEEVSVVKKTLDGLNFESRLKKSQLSRRPWMVWISSQDWRSLSCQEDLGWSEFQVKSEEVSVVKKTLDGQNFKSRLKKSQLSRRPWMVRISSQDWRSLSCLYDLGCSVVQMRMKEGENSPKQPIAGIQLTST